MNEQRELTFKDAFNLLCGSLIGQGQFRQVFECTLNSDYVIKVEVENIDGWRSFHNVLEVEFWREHQYNDDIAPWLAPIHSWSPDMRVIAQRRVTRIPDEQLPKKMPKFLTDVKPGNYGMLDGRVVCCDYARTVSAIPLSKRKVEWFQ